MTQVQPDPEETEQEDEQESILEHPTLFDQDNLPDDGS